MPRTLDARGVRAQDRRMRPFVALLAAVFVAAAAGCGGDVGGVIAERANRAGTALDPTVGPAGPTAVPNPQRSVPNGFPSNPVPVDQPVQPVQPIPDVSVEPPPGGATGNGDAVMFRPFTVVDPASNGIAALDVLVPAGWEASGSVEWMPLWARLAILHTRVRDPFTGLTIDWLPVQNFMYFTPPAGFEVPIGGNYQGKAYVPPITDPVQFVREFWMPSVLSHLQNATVAFVEDQPAIAQEAIRGSDGNASAGAWRIRYEYDFEGVAWEQDVSFSLLWVGNDPLSWYVNLASTAGAPRGELDRQAGVVSAVISSRRTTVEWEANYRLVTQLFYQGIQQQMADTVRFGELLAQYRAESQALQQQVFDERMASIDRQNQIFRETLGGVQGYDDPVNGGVVQLPLGWDTYWVNQQGEYIAVSDPDFDPNTLNDGVWTQLEPRA